MTSLEIVDLPADRLPGDALVVPLFEDQRPLDGPAAVVDWRMDGVLTRMLLDGELSGKRGECLALRSNHKFAAPWVLVAGAGKWPLLDRTSYVGLVGRLLKMAAKAGIGELALCLPPVEDANSDELARIVSTAMVGSLHPDLCRLSRVARFG